ncbi:MAG: NCS2 family permease, partial [Pisciglobus halotolerans]|nr:NCS2 family permease [Pisciglobus halotolerans]
MIENFFKLTENKTTVKTEVMAGITTFMTMAYVLVVQPGAIVGFGPGQVLTDINGVVISKSALLVVTALISGLITLLMALYANLPFALSTGMGTNFMLGALLQNGTLSFGNMMVITLISGITFVLLSVLGIRDFIVRAIPTNIKTSISVAIGFFIAYLGFKNSGIGNFQEGISLGDFTQPSVFLSILGLILIAGLTVYRVPGALLIGITLITLAGIPLGVTHMPDSIFAVPEIGAIQNISFAFDFKNLLTGSTFVLIFITFCSDFFSTLGTVLGVAQKANLLDEKGDYPEIQRPFIVDAVGTCVGSFTGCTTITTFVESSAGVEAGGRTGLTSLTSSFLFFMAVLAAPLFLMIPDAATGTALIFVGYSMISSIGNIDFTDFMQAFGPFIMIVFTVFTGSIATGISAGILADVAVKTVAPGREEKIHPA